MELTTSFCTHRPSSFELNQILMV